MPPAKIGAAPEKAQTLHSQTVLACHIAVSRVGPLRMSQPAISLEVLSTGY